MSRVFPIDPGTVAETLWDTAGWRRVWNPVSEVRVARSDLARLRNISKCFVVYFTESREGWRLIDVTPGAPS